MLRLCLAAALIAIAGCSDPVADAEEEHGIALRSARSGREKCQIERKLADAYLKARREDKYSLQKTIAGLACSSADVDDLFR